MQTFVPFADHKRTARVLDNKRLMKQLVEAKQILLTLCKRQENRKDPGTHEKVGWEHHPAVLMWEGYEQYLAGYLDAMFTECKKRGMNVSLQKYIPMWRWGMEQSDEVPHWWGGPIHWTHRRMLCHKDWDHYGRMFPTVAIDDAFPPEGDPKPEYFWPRPVVVNPEPRSVPGTPSVFTQPTPVWSPRPGKRPAGDVEEMIKALAGLRDPGLAAHLQDLIKKWK